MARKKKTSPEKKATTFEKIAAKATQFTGSLYAFVIAAGLVVVWAATGPLFGFSEGWQLVINTGTTIITFLMVFIIQHSQNKDTLALQLKLDELIYSISRANNDLIDAENLREEDLVKLREHYEKMSAKLASRVSEKEKSKGKNSK